VSTHAQNDGPRSISRRRIVRSTATVAWIVPAISLASAVPAFASNSGADCCDLSLDGSATWRTGELNYIDISLDLTNACSTAVSGLMLTLQICGVEDITYAGDPLPAGWVKGGQANKPLAKDGDGCYTLTFADGGSLPSGSNNLTFTAKSKAYTGNGHKRPGGAITAVLSAPNCSSVSKGIVLPAIF
jgi:hypothetical protein